MPMIKSASDTTRVRILDAAERLLRQGEAEFSMRALAAEAGVSFATPFNQFGSKAAIMQAMSAERIDRMAVRFRAAAPRGNATDRVLAAVEIAVGVLLEEPEVSRAVIASLGSASASPGAVLRHSRELWTLAIADADGLGREIESLGPDQIAGQLALGFRGCVSFWTAGEITDAELPDIARTAAAWALLAVADGQCRDRLLAVTRGLRNLT